MTTDARTRERKVYDQIHRAIAERRLLPGAKLTEEALAEVFNVSRARIRRVLLLLAKEDVVKLELNRGAFVWRPSVSDAKHVLHARRIIEFELVKEAALNASKEQVADLRRIVAEEDKAIRSADYALSIRLSGEFHMALARCANNPILTEFLASLISRSYLILATYQRRDAQSCPNSDHQRLVDLIAKRDAEGALKAQQLHFEHIEHELDLAEKSTTRLNLKQIFLDRD
jgi:DNA-binding GntR family transcriptional regulator